MDWTYLRNFKEFVKELRVKQAFLYRVAFAHGSKFIYFFKFKFIARLLYTTTIILTRKIKKEQSLQLEPTPVGVYVLFNAVHRLNNINNNRTSAVSLHI